MTNERSPTGVDMTAGVPEIDSADWIIVTVFGNAMPPRDPNDDDDDDEEEEEDDDEPDDESPVIREPDE
jgi:hypothetical protein